MKKELAVVTGGYSGEKTISVKSADFVKSNIDTSLYNVHVVYIDQEKWVVLDESNEYPVNRHDFSYEKEGVRVSLELVYLILHGDPGENGKLQAYFELLNIPYTSCDSVTSALTFNKFFTNKTVTSLGIKTAASYHLYKKEEYDISTILERTSLPCFVKPNAGGSSIGMSKVNKREELEPAIQRAFVEDDEVLVESFISGRELTCAVIDSRDKMYALPICEIVSKKEFFDFEAKYDPTLADEIIPAQIEDALTQEIENLSVFVYTQLNCKGMVRVDYIWDGTDLYFLEVNSIPGLSGESIVPKMAKAFGWSSNELIARIIETASIK